MTSTRSLPMQPADPGATARRKRFGLSWTQIAAAGFASITATVILSFFSISGTLIGAAVFSMASAVGNAVYGQSLRTTQDRVLDVVPFGGRADPASPTVVLPVVDEPVADERVVDEPVVDEPPALPASAARTLSRRTWKRVALTALSLFAFVITVITTVELVAGRPLTDVLRGDQGSGTSLFGGTSGGGAPAPTVTRTVTPSVIITTPTVTQTAPAVTTTAPPSTATTTPATTAPSTSGTSGGSSAVPSSGTPASSQTPSP